MTLVTGDRGLRFATSIDNSGLKNGVINAQGIIRGFASNIDKLDVFAGLSVGAAIAFKNIATDAFNMSKEYEQTMLEVQTISQATTEDFSGMSEAILNVGLEVPQSANELAKAYYQIASAGYDGAAGLQLLDVSAKAAIGGVTDVETAANGVTSIMNAWKISAEGAEGITDKLFKTVKLGKTTFPQLSNNISQVASIASSASIPLEEILAAVASLTKTGVPTAQAFTQIKSAILSTNKVLGDGWSKTMTFQDGLQSVSDQAGGSQNEILKLVGRSEALNAILGLTGQNAKVAASDLSQISDSAGAAGVAFDQMVSSAENQSKLLAANIEAAFKPLGDFLLKNFKTITEFLNQAFQSGDVEKFAKVVATSVTALVAYKTATKLSSISMMDLKRGLVIARRAMQGLNTAMKLNPMGLLAAGIAAAATAFVLFRNNAEDANIATEIINKNTQKYTESLEQETAELGALFAQLKSTNKGSDERARLIDTINGKYGTTLQNLENEEEFLKGIDKTYTSILNSLKAKIALQTQEAVLTELIKKENELKKEQLKLQKDINFSFENYSESYVKQSSRYKKAVKDISDYETQIKLLQKTQKDVLGETAELLDGVISQEEELVSVKSKNVKDSKSVKQKEIVSDLVEELEVREAIVETVWKEKSGIDDILVSVSDSETDWNKIAGYIFEGAGALNQMGDAIGDVNEDLGKTINIVADIAKDVGGIAQGIASGNYLQVAVAGVNLVTKLFTIRKRKAEEAQKAEEEALERQKELFAQITTTTSESITDSILEGFKNGKFAAEDFAEDFETLMKNAMLETFKVQFLQKQFDEFYKAFGDAAESDGALSESEIADLKEQFNANIVNAQEGFDAFNEMFEGVFGEGATTSGNTEQGMSGEIRASLTEETGTVLAGTMNSMRLFIAQQNEILEDMNNHLSAISINTANNVELQRLENIESLLAEQAQSLRSTGA